MGQITDRLAAKTEAAASTAVVVRHAIERQGSRLDAILPSGLDRVRFQNLVLTAVKKKPGLMECFDTDIGQTSVLIAVQEAAALGLEPDTPMLDCWLLPRRNKGRMECELSIGYQGLVRLARRSGEIKSLGARVVRQGDEFHYAYGLQDDILEHKPAPSDRRGDLTYAYAVVRYLNGGYDFVVLDKTEVEHRRAKSDSYKSGSTYSPWVTSPDSMWRKSAIRELSKLMPKSVELARADATDERVLTFDTDGDVMALADDDVVDAEIVDEPEADA